TVPPMECQCRRVALVEHLQCFCIAGIAAVIRMQLRDAATIALLEHGQGALRGDAQVPVQRIEVGLSGGHARHVHSSGRRQNTCGNWVMARNSDCPMWSSIAMRCKS